MRRTATAWRIPAYALWRGQQHKATGSVGGYLQAIIFAAFAALHQSHSFKNRTFMTVCSAFTEVKNEIWALGAPVLHLLRLKPQINSG
jgi:hypothetical protein